MASKPKKSAGAAADDYPRRKVDCVSGPSADEKGRSIAKLITSPEMSALRVVAFQPKVFADEIDTPGMLDVLRDQAAAVNRGDLSHAEAMLSNQATALQSLFARLTERAMEQTQMAYIEGFMRMALRAQSQCRATLETLAAIKNPPVVFAKQANIAAGHQQINNGTAPPARAREIENEPTQLSEGTHELLPDARASGQAGRVDSALETLGEVDRAKVRAG